MRSSFLRASGSFLLGLSLFLMSQAFGQKDDSPDRASKGGFQKGQLLKIESVTDLQKTSEKAGYLIRIQSGTSRYVGHYTLNYFQHDHSKELEEGKDIDYRIEGKHLIVKTPKGDEIKMRLCKEAGNCVQCGGMTVCSPGQSGNT